MKTQSTIAATPLTVLSVSPIQEDHVSLQAIMRHSNWRLLKADNAPTARILLQERNPAVVLCECDLILATWIDMLLYIQSMQNPPSLIVTSRLADDRLWAEALNLGAWDVM